MGMIFFLANGMGLLLAYVLLVVIGLWCHLLVRTMYCIQ